MPTHLETLSLHDEESGARAWLAPTRGGIVTRFEVAGVPILYLDEGTLLDASKKVRGGNPVLFPSPGPLADDHFTWRGTSGAMKQHGVARTRPWRVSSTGTNEATLELASDAETIEQFPWDFALRFRHVVRGRRLTIEERVENRSRTPMPFALGFHPYFAVTNAEKRRARIPTSATRAWDNVRKQVVPIAGPIDLGGGEVDLHLLDHGASEAALLVPGGRGVRLYASKEFRRWVVWTLPDQDFVCLEPWTSGANALNTEEDLLVLEPGESRELSFAIEAL